MRKLNNKKTKIVLGLSMAFALGGLATSAALFSAQHAIESRAEDSSASSQSSVSSSSSQQYPYHVADYGFMSVSCVGTAYGGQQSYSFSGTFYLYDGNVHDDLSTASLTELWVKFGNAPTQGDYDVVTFDSVSISQVNSYLKVSYSYHKDSSPSYESRFLEAPVYFEWKMRLSSSSAYSYHALSGDFVGSNTFYSSGVDSSYVGQEDGASYTVYSPEASNNVGGGSIVTNIATWLTAGLEQMGNGIGSGVTSFVQNLAIKDGSLSPYFIMVVAFGGIALACGITRRITQWTENLGA